ncbi:MAG: hypothetical protein HZA91_05795, partial [Verrucomicrobia bacterium]|nr:hypothetical protein [Verrucomicrobiota bacterium]
MTVLALVLFSAQVAVAAEFAPPGENIALGKSYKLDPRPNYSYCTDPSDREQLTDGVYTKGHFWTQKSTVGWTGIGGATITIDLGTAQPIRGVSFNSAAGAAGVTWPASIVILVSDDGKSYYPAGELINLSMKHGAAPQRYTTHRFWTGELRTHGRYVSLLVTPGGPYTFVDEIEVYRGEPDWVKLPFSGEGVTDAKAYQLHAAFEHRIRKDLLAVREAAAKLTGETRSKVMAELDAIEREIPSMPRRHDPKARATLPLNPIHDRVFRAQAMVWRAQEVAQFTASSANPWDPLGLSDPPPRNARGGVSVAMMQNEYRSGTLNISNAGESAVELRLQIAGLPGGTNPSYVTVHEVAWTDTRKGIAVTAALPEARRDGNAFVIAVSSGMTRQVWFTFHPTNIKPGTHRGTLVLDSLIGKQRVPLTLRVYPLRFPDRPAFHLGGWDYSDAPKGRDVTPENREAFIRILREHFVDSPWATGAVLPYSLDTARFDEWLHLWPGARQYCVFA